MRSRILVVRRGGLGDTLMMLPALHALRRLEPHSEVHLAGVREHVEVLWHHGHGRCCSSVEDLQLWALDRDGPVAARARDRLSAYGRILADDPAVLAMRSAGVETQVFDPRPDRQDVPMGEQLLDRVVVDRAKRQIPVEHHLLARPAARRTQTIVLAPGSGSPGKCWPAQRWLDLAGQLVSDGSAVAVVAGPVERDGDDPWRWSWPVEVEWIRDRTVVELALSLRSARAFVGNDSGPTHLAAALWVPTLAIFGPTDPRVWAPVGDHVRVVGGAGAGAPNAAVQTVVQCLREM